MMHVVIHNEMSPELKAVLWLFNADNELRRKALPYVDVKNQHIDWKGLFQNDFGGGHLGVIAWAQAIWQDEVPKVDPFERAFAMGPNLQRAVLNALALRWGLIGNDAA